MGFVVEKIPFGDHVVTNRAIKVVGVGKGFDARTEDWVALPDFESALPDDFSNVAGLADANVDIGARG